LNAVFTKGNIDNLREMNLPQGISGTQAG